MQSNGKGRILWITWEKHRRTRQLHQELVTRWPDAVLHEITMDAHRLIRYPVLLFRTLKLLILRRPSVLIIQNPSVILALFSLTVGRIFSQFVIVDSHNEGIRPFHARFSRLLPLYRFMQRRAHLTIVTNKWLADEVLRNGGTPFVLPDKIPSLIPKRKVALKGRYNLVYICTFEKDEPYREIFKAARLLDDSRCVYVTGKPRNLGKEGVGDSIPNVISTGYLTDEDYTSLLASSDAVIDLTEIDNCLVCGAYEALSVNKPLVLSDTRALRSYFRKGAVYTKNSAPDIAGAVEELIKRKDVLDTEIVSLRHELETEWKTMFHGLCVRIDSFLEQSKDGRRWQQ